MGVKLMESVYKWAEERVRVAEENMEQRMNPRT